MKRIALRGLVLSLMAAVGAAESPEADEIHDANISDPSLSWVLGLVIAGVVLVLALRAGAGHSCTALSMTSVAAQGLTSLLEQRQKLEPLCL